nr:MAG TPA: hypothetical protein [Caudoviricetes sp.]
MVRPITPQGMTRGERWRSPAPGRPRLWRTPFLPPCRMWSTSHTPRGRL